MSITVDEYIQSIQTGIQRVEYSKNKDQFSGILAEIDDILWSDIQYVEDEFNH